MTPAGVQGWDRYAYANNSPVKYNDPSGHDSVCGYAWSDPECNEIQKPVKKKSTTNVYLPLAQNGGAVSPITFEPDEPGIASTSQTGGGTATVDGNYPVINVADIAEEEYMYYACSLGLCGDRQYYVMTFIFRDGELLLLGQVNIDYQASFYVTNTPNFVQINLTEVYTVGYSPLNSPQTSTTALISIGPEYKVIGVRLGAFKDDKGRRETVITLPAGSVPNEIVIRVTLAVQESFNPLTGNIFNYYNLCPSRQ